MRFLKTLSLASTTFFASITCANADINVVTSIKPVHSLVSGVMEGVATPDLIIDTGGSPHTYSLKPSQARQLQNADIVFWISPKLEAFLEKPIESIATNALVLQLLP
jgi:zinc transport system substrate-binding protein